VRFNTECYRCNAYVHVHLGTALLTALLFLTHPLLRLKISSQDWSSSSAALFFDQARKDFWTFLVVHQPRKL